MTFNKTILYIGFKQHNQENYTTKALMDALNVCFQVSFKTSFLYTGWAKNERQNEHKIEAKLIGYIGIVSLSLHKRLFLYTAWAQ